MEHTNTLAALSDGMADAVAAVGPAVVRVNGRRRRSGTGVVYGPNTVLTASHVLEREEDLSVDLHDGRTLTARFGGRDHSTDLALLRVEGLDVEAATRADGEARVGQLALAVGSTSSRGEGPRATLGVISAVGGPVRTWRGPRLERYIQTDATPYPGFSGGALIDVGGKVLGSLVSGSRGTAFAVPADLAWRVATTLQERGTMKRGSRRRAACWWSGSRTGAPPGAAVSSSATSWRRSTASRWRTPTTCSCCSGARG